MVQTQLSLRRRRRELHSLWPIAATRYFNRNKRRHNVLTATTITICSHIILSIPTFNEEHIIRHLVGGTRRRVIGTPLLY